MFVLKRASGHVLLIPRASLVRRESVYVYVIVAREREQMTCIGYCEVFFLLLDLNIILRHSFSPICKV